MRCAEVREALGGETERRDAASVRSHLAACPNCAAEARAAATLERIWNQTRPAEPSAEAWETLWGRVVAASEVKTVPAVPKKPKFPSMPTSRRGWVTAFLVPVSLAAAVMAALGPVLIETGPEIANRPSTIGPIAQASPAFVIDDGQDVVISLDAAPRMRHLPPEEEDGVVTVAGNFEILNFAEALASN